MTDFVCVWETVKAWGPGMVIGIAMLYLGYRLLFGLGKYGIKKIGEALEKPAEALNMQAQSMDRLTTSIQSYVVRDQSEHREIIILQKVILEKIGNLGGEKDGRDEKRTL